MKPTTHLLITASALSVLAMFTVVAVGAWAGASQPATRVLTVARGNELAVLPAARAMADLNLALSDGPQNNPWNPASGQRVGPRVELPPPPPLPLPALPLVPVALP